ncbi:MAG: hypothetical protein KDA61_11665, partial [Planctomycetales bacterium]|nr:hypothetical protein [Planctomycetales bacterium]
PSAPSSRPQGAIPGGRPTHDPTNEDSDWSIDGAGASREPARRVPAEEAEDADDWSMEEVELRIPGQGASRERRPAQGKRTEEGDWSIEQVEQP